MRGKFEIIVETDISRGDPDFKLEGPHTRKESCTAIVWEPGEDLRMFRYKEGVKDDLLGEYLGRVEMHRIMSIRIITAEGNDLT